MEAPRARAPVRCVVIALAVLGVAFGGLLAATPRAAAITYVRGFINADTTWGQADTTYVIYQHVTVPPGVTLTILPGVTVRVDPMRNLFVEGRLFANGTVGTPINWVANSSVLLNPPIGIQFNATGSGSVAWNTFTAFDRPLVAMDSAPTFSRNVITTASIGIALVRANAYVADNTISRTQLGIYATESGGQIIRNSIDVSTTGIQVTTSGTPYVGNNRVTNVSASFAVGIYVWGGASANLWWNTVRTVQGVRGANGLFPGAPGSAGGLAAGILLDSPPSAVVVGNTVDQIQGGRGGDGIENPGGTGGRGGDGGAAVAIGGGNVKTVQFTGNIITNLYGGRGGNGGGPSGGTTVTAGDGGNAGSASAISLVLASTGVAYWSNSINGVTGGVGGNGGSGIGSDGMGGVGGEAIGVFSVAGTNADASGNFIQNVRGGPGGNSTALGGGTNRGGDGGDALGIEITGNPGASVLGWNTAWTTTGGTGGRGATGGNGGNATSVGIIGNLDGMFNATAVTGNHFLFPTGGTGGIGMRTGGDGGAAAGLVLALVTPTSSGNGANTVRGGNGGDAIDGSDGGRGGDAYGVLGFAVADGWSSSDGIFTVTKGAVGAGPPAQPSLGVGWTLFGDIAFTTRMTIENGTLTGIGDLDLQVNDFVDATTINTTFAESKLSIAATSILTVKNFLGVDVFWPNGVTPIPGASILVTDDGTPVWNFATATGSESWLLVTDRVYEGSIPARENTTEATVTYLSYSFPNDPRTVDMATSNTQPFVMVDQDAPVATASGLPPYENAATFSVAYTATDGNGTGLGTVTLWWRMGGGWTPYATQPGAPSGSFTFTATAGDGTYEFAATAGDIAGNQEGNPSANESWTVLDTVRPGSHVDPQPTWRNTATFLVSWAPDNGVTDIVGYEIQYNHAGSGWTTWLNVNAGTTSATFTASPTWGVYEFRSKARDAAGNFELPPATNDTWTIVDIWAPESTVLALPPYETSLTFPVFWDRVGDSYDIATFRIEVNDDGGGWTVWIASTANTTASFPGADGHTYEFRSIATDYAGNVEPTSSGNDTWTLVDATAPDSAVTPLPAYERALAWTLTWGAVAGTTDIATYTVQYSEDGGPWTDVAGATGITATTVSFNLGADGHAFAFRSLATDRAGNVEPGPAGNDTWTLVDTTPPAVVTSAPRGSGTNTTPLIVVTFSEPMDRAAAEAAFRITPDMNGPYSWTADSRTLTFTPARALDPATSYFVSIDTGAKDVAGNQMAQQTTFQFTTAALPAGGAGGVGDWWWLFAVIGAAVVGSLLVAMRVLRGRPAPTPAVAAKPKSDAVIDDVFLLYHDGILIKHETRRLKPDIDTDILSGMLTAVQSFVKDSFRTEDGELDELTFGEMHILIARGKWLILAAMVQGDGTVAMRGQIEKAVQEMEANHAPAIEAWDGNMSFAKVLSPYIKKLIRGEYA